MEQMIDSILEHPIVPVYYHGDKDTCIAVLKACYEGGIRVFEFVNRGEKSLENFGALRQFRDQSLPGLRLGIGTVKDAVVAQRFVEAGADFLVSPLVKAEIAEVTLKKGILWLPGCMTPTEIGLAEDLGARLVKIFPGETLGHSFLKSVRPLFPGMRFMITGGVSPHKDSIGGWFRAGASALGLGSGLFAEPKGARGYGWLSERVSDLTGGFTGTGKEQ